ncbi:PA2928 family protein [Listeria portnoyi]|uniref:PA2928 family protein n=1 Tax=Listeria portnoyi TaxID=2713504 RepID=UPI0024834C32|nr:PA2928 family protein [Listeria portnoyi]
MFSQKIIPKKSSVIDTAKLLSVSDNQIFAFYGGTIFVLDQKNGKIEHKIDSANSVPISSSSDFCKFDSSLNEVVFTCTDGLVYSLNLASLKTKKQPTIQANQYFAEKDLSDIHFARGITLQVLRNDKYNMFLSDSEIQNIKAGSKELPNSSLQDRRYLYTGNLDKPNELKKWNQQVFIGGGFLPKKESTLIDPYSSIDPRTNRNYSTYQEVAIHGETNSTGPFQLANPNQYLVVHRASTELSSNILLSCIDISSEQTLWTIDTEGDDIEGYTQIDKNHILLLCSKVNETSGVANTSHTLYLSLKDGSGKGYFFKYNKSFDIKKETN